jgi:hypothetical protein
MIPLRRHRRDREDVNMALEDLKKLIADEEGETVEVKETTRQRSGMALTNVI